MARIVFISNYLKGGKDAARLKNRVHYFATREGVEVLKTETASLPPPDAQLPQLKGAAGIHRLSGSTDAGKSRCVYRAGAGAVH
jgi:hypothetical protein